MDAIRAASAAAIVATAVLGAVASIESAAGTAPRRFELMLSDADDVAQIQYVGAELLWLSAEHEPNARIQVELWERAAHAFTDVAKANRLDRKRVIYAAHAAALAWQHAVARGCGRWDPSLDARNPRPIPERAQQLLAAYRLYGDTVGDSNADELSSIEVAEAREYARYGHVDEAIPLLYNIIERRRPGETLDEAVNVVVDLDRRLHGHDDIVAIVAQLGRAAVKAR